jgi:CRP/FNR family transcriptional regulator
VIVEALTRIPYLRALPGSEREDLAKVCQLRRVGRGECLFTEGDPPAGIFLILEGCIRLVRSTGDGREQVLHEERAGATLAEVPVFDGEGYVASAVAVDESVVLFVPRAPLLAALDRCPGSALEVIRILARRVRRFAALVEDLSLRDVLERLARHLLREAARQPDADIQLPATREELAAHVGTVREQASRALSELKRAGIIDVDGRRVRVLDEAALRKRAGW